MEWRTPHYKRWNLGGIGFLSKCPSMVELVDTRDLKSLDSNIVSVRLRLLGPLYPYNSMVEYATFNRIIPVQLWVRVPILWEYSLMVKHSAVN